MPLRTEKAPDKIPAGFKTAEEWSEEEGLSLSHTRGLLARAVQEGRFERQLFRVSGYMRPRPFYREIKKGK